MGSRREIILSDDMMSRCRSYGEATVRDYAEGKNVRSHMLSSHGADTNAELWARSKGGEVAFAIDADKDPMTAVNWSGRADSGYDVVAYGGLKWDVKTILARYRYLCWPINKNHLYFKKDFHMLVLVKADPPLFTIDRWMTKLAFWTEKQVADGEQPRGLTEGTWCVKDDDAWPIAQFFEWLREKNAP